MPSPRRLTKLYIKLFNRATGDELENVRLLADVLEMLSVSLRPLTLRELACAVTMTGKHGEACMTFQQMERYEDIGRILQIAKAFIARSDASKLEDTVVRPVHQSLREVVRETPPITWASSASNIRDHPSYQSSGNSIITKACIRYLLLEDCPDESMSIGTSSESTPSITVSSSPPFGGRSDPPKPREVTEHFLEQSSPILGNFFAQFDNSSTVSLSTTSGIYGYAVMFWAAHFRSSQLSEDSLLFNLAISLYRKMSPSDWDGHRKTLKSTTEGYPSMPDALTISSFNGHHTVLRSLVTTMEPHVTEIGSAVYWSAAQGHTQCIELLLPRLGSNTHLCCRFGSSPLGPAAANGHDQCLSTLLRYDLFDINEQDSRGRVPLSRAVGASHEEATTTILSWRPADQLDVNVADNVGWTPLFWAIGSKPTRILSKLLSDDRTDPQVLDAKGRNALSWACEMGLADTVKILIADARLDSSHQDALGSTPLIYAVRSRDFRTVRNLFRRNPSNTPTQAKRQALGLSARDKEGRNALSHAASVQDSRILQLLLKYASNEACVRDNNGWSPLAWTLDSPRYLQNAHMLLPYYTNHLDDRGLPDNSILSQAISWDAQEIAHLIIRRTNIDVNMKSDNGRTALFFATSKGWLETVKLLVEHRAADTAIVDDKGNTPLRHAQKAGQIEIARYLDRTSQATAGASRDT